MAGRARGKQHAKGESRMTIDATWLTTFVTAGIWGYALEGVSMHGTIHTVTLMLTIAMTAATIALWAVRTVKKTRTCARATLAR